MYYKMASKLDDLVLGIPKATKKGKLLTSQGMESYLFENMLSDLKESGNAPGLIIKDGDINWRVWSAAMISLASSLERPTRFNACANLTKAADDILGPPLRHQKKKRATTKR